MIGDIIEIERAKYSIGDVRTGLPSDENVLWQARKAQDDGAASTTPTPFAELFDAARRMLVALRRRGRST